MGMLPYLDFGRKFVQILHMEMALYNMFLHGDNELDEFPQLVLAFVGTWKGKN